MEKFKKVIPDSPIDTILPLKGAHRLVALQYIKQCVEKSIENRDAVLGIVLKEAEYLKVKLWIDKELHQVQQKIDKIKHGDN